jgi:hypothetical protein
MTYMLYSRISNQGGSLSSLHCELLSPTCYCCISMPASAQSPVWHSAVQAHGILSPLSVSRKGGERTGEDDLHSDDPSSSPLTVASEGGC